MSAFLYDTALIQKLNRWTEKTNVHIYGPEQTRQLFQLLADTNKDKPIELPIITIVRPNAYQIMNPNKRPLSYDGTIVASDDDGKNYALQLNAIPIQLEYQLNVYARKYQEADAYMRELIFNFINYPKLQITIPYHGSDIIHNCSIEIATNVEDTSGIPERMVSGQFTRLTMSFLILDAYLWDTRLRSYLSMDGELLIQSDIGDVVEEELELAQKENS